jgi:diguanylate cyclase (GGDEF)-like protein
MAILSGWPHGVRGLAAAAILVLLPWMSFAAEPASAPAAAASNLATLTIARLDADPVAMAVVTGEHDRDFVTIGGSRIHEFQHEPRWWRVTVDRRVEAVDVPQLVVQAPHQNRIEVWSPGRMLPVLRSLVGPDADPRFSTRGLVVSLPEGVDAGESIYLRVHSHSAVPMPVTIESLGNVHRADLVHVAWRTVLLAGLTLLAILALGFWIGIGERSYAYLMLTLLAQAGFFAASGGEFQMLPGIAENVGGDPRLPRLFALIAALSSLVFLVHYLDLRMRQATLTRVLTACGLVFGLLTLATLVSATRWIAVTANLVLMLATAVVLVAAVLGCLQRHRPAYFLLLSWLPMMALLLVRTGEVLGIWAGPSWLIHAFPATFVLSGLVIMIGLSDTLQQLRRDRDHASRLATFDGLTGAMSRPAIEARLLACVEESHHSGLPLSVVFFDIDKFKRINDDYGHGVGDGCLKIIVLRTRNRLRTYDLFGRWGGDEVLVLLPDTRLEEAIGVAENLRSAVNCRPLSINGHVLDASLSLGVAELAPGESASELLERADAALYASKSAGRDRVSGGSPVLQKRVASA